MKEKDMKSEVKQEVKPEVKPIVQETNDFRELYGKLRNEISKAKETYRTMSTQTDEAINVRVRELEILKIRKVKLEGAIEATEELLKTALPSNNKQ